MCGIAGYWGTGSIDDDRIRRCLELMRHRGPDAAAVKRWNHSSGQNAVLLHTRLSIIDLDPRANQPFRSGRRWIIYNGELYNYVELRVALEAGGTVFQTRSDTEVLIEHLGVHGLDGLDTCEGMWAFALYDEQSGELTLCRDRFGEKPLYMTSGPDGVFFASEIKCLFALRGSSPVNISHLKRYLVNGYKSLYKGDETFFENVHELPAATWRSFRPGAAPESHRYWRPRFQPDDGITYKDAVSGVRERLLHAVNIRLRSDVPLAFCMSGGVDSNALISIAKKVHGYDVHGFTISSNDARYDEEEIARRAARELDIKHTVLMADTRDFLPRLRALVRQHDAPVYTITYYAHWMIEGEIAKHGYRVSISGTGADELLSGYYDHHLAYFSEIQSDREFLDQSVEAWRRNVQPWVRNPFLSDPDYLLENPSRRDHIYLNAEELASYLSVPWREPFTEELYSEYLLRNRMLNELQHESVPVILHEDDLNAMAFSIENRSPFLDRELCDFCFRIPTRHLIRDGVAKALLRDAMRGLTPDCVLDSVRKVGFNLSLHSCLDTASPDVQAELLSDSPIFEHVRKDRIESLLKKRELLNSESKFLFSFINARLFLEECAA